MDKKKFPNKVFIYEMYKKRTENTDDKFSLFQWIGKDNK